MKTISRLTIVSLSAGIFLTLLVPQANAGCGDMRNFQGPFEFLQPSLMARLASPSTDVEALSRGSGSGSSATIVGLWQVQLASLGNTSHNPPIPDGAVIDFGYTEWHSDGTEILNSGTHAPATENFCLGVWGKTGFLTFEQNHFALSYDATTGALSGKVNIREQITLSPSGDSYTGTFTLDVYDPDGNHVDHLVGVVTGVRLTVDSKLP